MLSKAWSDRTSEIQRSRLERVTPPPFTDDAGAANQTKEQRPQSVVSHRMWPTDHHTSCSGRSRNTRRGRCYRRTENVLKMQQTATFYGFNKFSPKGQVLTCHQGPIPQCKRFAAKHNKAKRELKHPGLVIFPRFCFVFLFLFDAGGPRKKKRSRNPPRGRPRSPP
ncbi:uncharacterized protein TEOVI_000908100 [Trypanosoma equiperdum]|uniref:Uncharacterized protein n=2 Tax=Trypanozoon TaxID=39700 RepID=Q382Y0_TRYB2|nr:hypothetical protein Tb11.01.3830 [Trypanosoma brucei brucei TREU927]EAN80151.1 hypothetical protein Tb11.01.3830 [Trypanosoma brucei brucei TREU927]SCU67810.1 hypothetical protein, conserved [Trypanosoma equiperdum]